MKNHQHSWKRFLLSLAAALMVSGSLSAVEYKLEKHHIQWTGSMPSMTHTGLLTPKDFDIVINKEGKVESLTVVLDMNSINVTDLNGGKRKKLMKHLRSADFFDVKKHPTAQFVMDSHKNGELNGNITIRGTTKPFTIKAIVKGHADRGWILSGDFTFNRQDFSVNYQNSGFFGAAKDKLIRDEVTVEIELKVIPEKSV